MTIPPAVKNILSTVFRFLLSFALLYYLYLKIDITRTVEVVTSARVPYLLYAMMTFFVINVILLLRWRLFLRAMDVEAPFISITRYFFVGLFGNLFLPSAIGGDVIKTVGLCRYSSQKATVVATVLLDRLSGFAGMVVIASLSFLFGHRLLNDVTLLVSIVMMAVASSAIVLVLFNEKLYSFCCRVFSFFPKLKSALMQVHYDVVLLKDKRYVLYQAVGMSCLSQITLAVTFFLVAKALHQDVALLYFLIFVPLICVASSMPSIGGLGVREAGAAFLLAKVGVESGVAVSISLINFLYMVLVGLLGGLIFLVTRCPMSQAGAETRQTETAG